MVKKRPEARDASRSPPAAALLLYRHTASPVLPRAENLPHPRPRRNLPWTAPAFFEPFVECAEFHAVLDWRISRQDANREVLADVFDPITLANRPEAERHGFVEAFSSDLGCVLDPFPIVLSSPRFIPHCGAEPSRALDGRPTSRMLLRRRNGCGGQMRMAA